MARTKRKFWGVSIITTRRQKDTLATIMKPMPFVLKWAEIQPNAENLQNFLKKQEQQQQSVEKCTTEPQRAILSTANSQLNNGADVANRNGIKVEPAEEQWGEGKPVDIQMDSKQQQNLASSSTTKKKPKRRRMAPRLGMRKKRQRKQQVLKVEPIEAEQDDNVEKPDMDMGLLVSTSGFQQNLDNQSQDEQQDMAEVPAMEIDTEGMEFEAGDEDEADMLPVPVEEDLQLPCPPPLPLPPTPVAEKQQVPPPPLENDKEGHLIACPGNRIKNFSIIKKKLGSGVYATVYPVRDLKAPKSPPKALKVLRNTKVYRDAAEHEIRVLEQLKKKDKKRHHFVIQLQQNFTFYGHRCLIFEQCGLSIFDFMKKNTYHPYPIDQIRYIAYQLIHAIQFVHNCGYAHTDLKPENIMIVNSAKCVKIKRWDRPDPQWEVRSRKKNPKISVLKDATIRLIDLGSAVRTEPGTLNTGTHCTRHYRAPEIILKFGWSFPSDVWSLGCIIFELYTGHFLFPKEKDITHLAMIEKATEFFPTRMKRRAFKTTGYYDEIGNLRSDERTKEFVKAHTKFLDDYKKSNDDQTKQLFILIKQMLNVDPDHRITLEDAKSHRFFDPLEPRLRALVNNGGVPA